MPAQKVYGMQHVTEGDADRDADWVPQVPIVDVRWARDDGFVQIVTKATDADGGRFADGDGYHVTDGFYVDLDRRQINSLIRNLRRARDQACGRDE